MARWYREIGKALRETGTERARVQLINFFEKQGMSRERAETLAQDVVGGKRPIPEEVNIGGFGLPGQLTMTPAMWLGVGAAGLVLFVLLWKR